MEPLMTNTKKPKPRKLDVFNFKDACKALRAALDEIDQHKIAGQELLESRDAALKAKSDEFFARRNAEDAAKAARAEHDDLKKRLLNSELECARLRGYMERVREDDAVADPLVEIEDQNGKRMVSKRWPSNHCTPVPTTCFDGGTYEDYTGRRPKPKHWVTY
jgi:hypothetical protein